MSKELKDRAVLKFFYQTVELDPLHLLDCFMNLMLGNCSGFSSEIVGLVFLDKDQKEHQCIDTIKIK